MTGGRRPRVYDVDIPDVRVKVVCTRGHRESLLHMLVWRTDVKAEDAFRRSGVNIDAVEVAIVNDRLGHLEEWTTDHGKPVTYPSPEMQIPEDQWADARALNLYRFKCSRCGLDVPRRKDRLNEWIEDQVAAAPSRRVFTLDISG